MQLERTIDYLTFTAKQIKATQMNKTNNLPGRMMALQLKNKHLLYNSYMAFFEHGGLFVPTDDAFSLGDEVLLALELAEHPDKKFLRTQVAWINPARTSANRPKGNRPGLFQR